MVSISDKGLLGLDFGLLSVSFVFLCLRLYVQIFRLHAFSTADALVIAAWLCFLINMIVDHQMRQYGFYDPRLKYTADGRLPPYEDIITDKVALRKGFILGYYTCSLYLVELYAIKIAFVLLYYRWFPKSMSKLRWALHATYLSVILGGLTSIFLSHLWCLPIRRNWSMNPADRCISWVSVPVYFYYSLANIFTDILVYVLPFFLLPSIYRTASRLQMAGIAFVFSVGTLSIACTLCRTLLNATETDGYTIAVWFTAEQAAAIVAICCAPLRWLCTYEFSRSRRRTSLPNWEKLKKLKYFSRSGSGSGKGRCEVEIEERDIEEGRDAVEPAVTVWTEGSGTHGSQPGYSFAGSVTASFHGGGLGLPRQSDMLEVGEALEPSNSTSTISNCDRSGNTSQETLSQTLPSLPPEAKRTRHPRQWWGTRKLKKAALKRPSVTTTFGGTVAAPNLTNLDAVAEEQDRAVRQSYAANPSETTGEITSSPSRASLVSFTFGKGL